MQRWIMHLDMDAFFASIEQRDRPKLRGHPVVVGAPPGQRGVVATCSYEARRFGIRSAMPISEAYRRCPDAAYLRPDMPRYASESRRVMQLLQEFSPLVEPVSIDEAYLDVSGLERLLGPPEIIGQRVRLAVAQGLGLSASVGIGPNRLIAKLASDHHKPDGLTLITPQKVQAFLDPMPVERMRGVGERTSERLHAMGIRHIGQLRRCPPLSLVTHLGRRAAEALLRQARGQASDRVEETQRRKSLSKEITFAHDQTDPRRLHAALRELAAAVGSGVRREGLYGRCLTLKIRFAGFETHTRQRRLEAASHNDGDIYRNARVLLQEAWRDDRPIRLIGLGLSEWERGGGGGQMDLFTDPRRGLRDEALMQTLDRVNARFGNGKLGLGLGRDGRPGRIHGAD